MPKLEHSRPRPDNPKAKKSVVKAKAMVQDNEHSDFVQILTPLDY